MRPTRDDDAHSELRRQAALAQLSRLALDGAPPDEVEAAATALLGALEGIPDFAAQVAGIVAAARRRWDEEERRRLSEERLAEAQRIGRMGSYDWDIASDTNAWSDELYRIYGTEPQSFNASYERFLSFVHPDSRQFVIDTHQRAYAECGTYQMEERIVRPDGEERLLLSWGEVVAGSDGKPARMRGICQDVTEERRSAAALQTSLARFEALIDATPDAVLVVDDEGLIRQANAQVTEFGYRPDELVGQSIDVLLPERLRDAHRAHRADYLTSPRSRSMGVGLSLFARHKDGTEIPVDVALGPLASESGVAVAAFVRDVTERRHAEQLALQLHDTEVRRRHALEINDNVVQGLASALYAFEAGQTVDAAALLRDTLASARLMMNDLLAAAGAQTLAPGDLVRARPAPSSGRLRGQHAPVVRGRSGRMRVVIADDAADIRLLLRLTLERAGRFEIVAEAENGAQAIERAVELGPDAVLIDLAMPVMDGLEAIPIIREALPPVAIIAVSGFDEAKMRPAVIDAGADAYLEKGAALKSLVELLDALCPLPDDVAAEEPAAPAQGERADDDPALLGHELRTPLTVIQGVAATLLEHRAGLDPERVDELLRAVSRNAIQMRGILDAVNDARRLGDGELTVSRRSVDLTRLVAEVVDDLGPFLADHPVEFDAPGDLVISADPVRVRQVVTNLLTNAARFTPAGTPVLLRLAVVGDLVSVTCEDRGPGVPAGRENELFRRYSRLEPGVPGMGLGLYISRAVARAHGGDLTFERPSEGGSRFVLRLPAKAAAGADRAVEDVGQVGPLS